MDYFNGTSAWIAPEDGLQSCHPAGRAMLFRRRFQGCGRLVVAVCADSEYRLFCNGKEIAQGPALADDQETFYDICDITDYLQNGENELLAQVVGFATAYPDFYRGGCPMARMAYRDAFILDGTLFRADGTSEVISTGEGWEAAEASNMGFFRCAGVPCSGPGEAYISHCSPSELFAPAQIIEVGQRPDNVKNTMLHYQLVPKRIPDLKREKICFSAAFDLHGVTTEDVYQMLQGGMLEVPANRQAEFVLDCTQEVTGRLLLAVQQGRGSIDFFYSEHLFDGEKRHFSPQVKHQMITGPMRDCVQLEGGACCWKSFFYRAFRFVRVVVTSTDIPVLLRINEIEIEHYPYQWQGELYSNSPVYERMWEMGKRTLELCSHSIYEDCPYYERLQYSADSRIASWIACMMTGDTRLTEQAIVYFRHSMQREGLTAGSYPSRSPVLLPPWSLHFVMMVQECYQFTGKKKLLEENLPAIRQILEWFLRHRLPEGGIGKLPYWNMVDFSPQWSWLGEPPGVAEQPSAFITFFIMECLNAYKDMVTSLDNIPEAQWAQKNYEELSRECTIFWDPEKGVYADTPALDSFSLLTNAQAVLASLQQDTKSLRQAMMLPFIKRPSPFGNTFVFKAFMERNDQEYADMSLDRWNELLVEGRSVFPEGTPVPRSECHVWSAFPSIGIGLLYTGLRFANAGGEQITLAPWHKKGMMIRGKLHIHQGVMEYSLMDNVLEVLLPDGVTLTAAGMQHTGENRWQYRW